MSKTIKLMLSSNNPVVGNVKEITVLGKNRK
jgi:hypothetical protein